MLTNPVDERQYHVGANWLNLNNSFGYVPLGNTVIYQEREETDGNAFIKLGINHGTDPKNGKYSYVMLPDATCEETEEFFENPTIEVLAATDNMHAVRDLESGAIGINAFSGGQSLCGITFEDPCSVMIKGNEILVTDPSQTRSEITLTFDADITAVSDSSISQNGNSVTVNMTVRGRTYSFIANGY